MTFLFPPLAPARIASATAQTSCAQIQRAAGYARIAANRIRAAEAEIAAVRFVKMRIALQTIQQ